MRGLCALLMFHTMSIHLPLSAEELPSAFLCLTSSPKGNVHEKPYLYSFS
jgi:hypothetical protein